MSSTTEVRYGVLQNIKDCGEPDCPNDGRRRHSHALNPRGEALKSIEMTVWRALQLIEAFDELGKDQDWTDVKGSVYRRVIGERYDYPRMIEETWKRYKDGTLYRQVLELADNLAMDGLSKERRKELRSGLTKIGKRLDSR